MDKNKANVPKIRFPGFTDPWEQRKLGECFTERQERSSSGELISVTINYGIMRASDLGKIDNSSNDKSKYKKVEIGDIAYNSMRMWQGASGYSTYSGILSPAYTVIIPRKDVDALFFSFMFKKSEMIQTFQNRSQGMTSDTWNLKFPAFSKIKINIPEKQEQEKIGKFLRELDNLIILHQRKLNHLQDKKKSLLQKMFPKDGEKFPELRFPGFTDPWKKRKLGDVVSIKSGLSPSCFHDGEILYVKVDDLNRSIREQDDSQMKVCENIKASKVCKGSVIFPKRGAAIMTNKVRIMGDNGYMDTNMMALEPVDVNSDFLYLFISGTGLYKIADTSTIPQINNKHIEPYEIKMPKIEEQIQIGNCFRNIDNLITLHQRKLHHLQEQKKALLQQMFI